MAGSSLVATNRSRQVFTVGKDAYTVRDVIDAAFFRAELQPVWEELLRLQACERRAEEEELEADDAAVDTAAQAFRYDHDLITAEETEAWLAERDLTLSDFGDYFGRHYFGEAMGDQRAPERIDYFSASPELLELLLAELILSGELGRMADKLTRRLALLQEVAEPAGIAAIAAEREKFLQNLELVEGEVAGWLAALGRDEAWLDAMLELEATYGGQRERVLTPEARKREIGSLRLELTAFDVEIIEFDSPDAAREALLCVREDGLAMEEVADEGRYPLHRERLLLEDIAPEMQQQFLSIIPGTVLEPIEQEGAYRLCRVVGKNEPDPEDAGVRRRVEQRLLDRHFADAVSKHVRWDLLLS